MTTAKMHGTLDRRVPATLLGSEHFGEDSGHNARIVSEEGIKAIAYIFASVSILLTAGRLVMRWRNSGKLGVDDIFNAVAAVLVVPFTVVSLIAFPIDYLSQLHFLGLAEAPPTQAEVEYSYRLTIVTLLFFWLIIYVVKASFLALYWQIFAISARFRIVWWLTAAYTTISFGITWLSIFWQCGNPSDLTNLEACEAVDPVLLIRLLVMWCTLNVVGGLLLMALPIVMVTTRMMTLEKPAKIGLIGIFSLVLIDIAFDIVRTVYSLSVDLSYRTNYTAIWTFLEPTIAVIVCALPCYKRLISRNKSRIRTDDSDLEFSSRRRPQSTNIPIEMELGNAHRLHSRHVSEDEP